jgi:hypothetical protein
MKGIIHQTTASDTPAQNGVAERCLQTIIQMAKCMLYAAGLSNKFWGKTVIMALHILNHTPTSALDGKTPAEAWTGMKPILLHIRKFGCLAYIHIPKTQHTKLPNATKCIFIGFCEHSKSRLNTIHLLKIRRGPSYYSQKAANP